MKYLFIIFIFMPSYTLAGVPPDYCVFGKATGNTGANDSGWDKLKLSIPKYVVVNDPTKVSIEGPPLLGSDGDDTPIYTQYEGFVGEVNVGYWDGEGYTKVTFSRKCI